MIPLRPVLILAAGLLAACAARHPAPVIERMPSGQAQPAAPAAKPAVPEALADTYTVKRGDTLYAIALDHGLDYHELADWNDVANPNVIRAGDVLRLRAPSTAVQARPVTGAGAVETRALGASSEPQKTEPKAGLAAGTVPGASSLKTEPRARKLPYSEENLALLQRAEQRPPEPAVKPEPVAGARPETRPQAAPQAEDDRIDWGWPAAGKVIAGYSEPGNKGVDIGGKPGEPVYASASGKVMYVGAGIRGYGNLVIVKHNSSYLSAYGHNRTILVKEGQNVAKGQKIAEIGSSDSDTPKLHFEIRRFGKPVDPSRFLPERPS